MLYDLKKGFTTIELVVAIVIVGILASAALPRFSNVVDQALIATNHKHAGDLQSGINILHATWILNGAPSAANNLLPVECTDTNGITGPCTVPVNSFGWPTANAGSSLSIGANYCSASLLATWLQLSGGVEIACCNAPATPCNNPSGFCYYVSSAAVNGVCTYQLTRNQSFTPYGFRYDYIHGTIIPY